MTDFTVYQDHNKYTVNLDDDELWTIDLVQDDDSAVLKINRPSGDGYAFRMSLMECKALQTLLAASAMDLDMQ